MAETSVAALGVALALVCGAAQAQAPNSLAPRTLTAGAQPIAAPLSALNGLVGSWVTAFGAGGWSAPVAGQIVGHIVLTDDKGAPRIQELWMFKEEGGTLVLRQKIIEASFVEREPKDQYELRRLIARENGALYFENMTIVPKGDSFQIQVRRPGGDLLVETFTRAK